MSNLHKYSFALALVLFGLGMVGWSGLNYMAESRQSQVADVGSVQGVTQNEAGGSVLAATTTAKTLEERVATLESKVAALEKRTTTSTSTSTSSKPKLKEQTVFIGSGYSSNTTWTDVDSISVELNSANYPGVKQVFFEATLSIVGGEASARLKNKTTGGVLYQSEVKHNSSTPTVKLSVPFALGSGSNEYVVQLRSSSNEKAVLDSARLRLLYE